MKGETSRASSSAWWAERILEVPPLLADAIEAPLPDLSDLGVGQWDVFGVGGSEGPARLMVAMLNEQRGQARLVPTSFFFKTGRLVADRSGLIVFSQGLSPHARLVLSAAGSYRRCIVISAQPTERVLAHISQECAAQPLVFRHGPAEEKGSLVRVVGPICAAALGARIAYSIQGSSRSGTERELEQLPRLYQRNSDENPEVVAALEQVDPRVCLAMFDDLPAAHQLMWKWQEAFCAPLPVAMDALSFAHGPYQSIYEHPTKLLILCSSNTRDRDDIWTKVQSIVVPGRHEIVRLVSKLESPLSYFDFDAQLLSAMERVIRRRGIDLFNWPGKDKDRPLYELELSPKGGF